MSVEPEKELLQNTGAEVMVLFFGLSRGLTLYETNNSAITRLVDALAASVQRFHSTTGESLQLKLLAEEFFVNGRLLKVDAQLYERATNLAAILARFEIGEITFDRGAERSNIDALVADFSQSIRSGKSQIKPEGYGPVRLGKASGRSVASYRFDPRKLATLLYGSLLDLVDKLYKEYDAGQSPSLLPLKRSFQLIIDNMLGYGGIYQVLAAVRDPAVPVSRAALRVATAIDVIGYGHYLDLPKTDLMYLALGGILGGLTEHAEPDEAVRPLFKFKGLGDAAMPLILAVHDTRASRQGKPVGIPGRMLAVAEVYQELTSATEQRAAVAPSKALTAMVEGRVKGVDRGAAAVFFSYKGQYPLGSLVRLQDGRVCVVLAHGEGETGKVRPVVARLTRDQQVGDRIELQQAPHLQIVDTPNPSEVGFNLAET